MEIAVGSQPGLWDRKSAEAHAAEELAPGVVLLAVADGFGDIRGTSVASVTINVVRDMLKRRVRRETRDPRVQLMAAFSAANARIFAQCGSSDDVIAGGASLTGALILDDHAYIAHVGTARAYISHDGELTPLTEDDALAGEEWSRARSQVPTEARIAPLITRSLGTQATLEASVLHVRLMHADALVFATGRIHENITGDEISYALHAAPSSSDVASRLLEILKLRGVSGGGTVIVGRALTEPGPRAAAQPTLLRNAAFSLAVLVGATLVAVAVVHSVFAP